MALKGDLESISLPSLFQLLEGDRKTGVLTIEAGPFERKLYIHQGAAVCLLSQDPKDLFGQFLLRNLIITEEMLIRALREQEKKAERLGDILKRMASLPEDKIKTQLLEKLKESIYQLFLLEKASFYFEDISFALNEIPVIASLPIQNLLLEGLRRYDEYKELKAEIPKLGQTFVVLEDQINDRVKEDKTLAFILDWLKKGACVADLCLQLRAYEYTILHYLSLLLKEGIIQRGLIREVKEKPPAHKPADELMKHAQAFEVAGNYVRALDVYKDILLLDPGQEVARRRIVEMQRILCDNLSRKLIPKTAVFKIKTGVDYSSLKLSPFEGFLLSRVNGQSPVGDLLSIIPFPETDALLALKNLLDLGVIEKK